MVSHRMARKLDAKQNQQSSTADHAGPAIALPTTTLHEGSQDLNFNDVMRLQRVIGNRATNQLISSRSHVSGGTLNRSLGGGAMIQRVMSAEAFKQSTKVNWSTRSDALENIDNALSQIEQAGADVLLLGELQKAIEAWFNTKEADGPRRDGVKALQVEVSEELRQVREHRENQGVVLDSPAAGPSKKYKKDYSDFDTKQFRVSGRAPNRMIEEVKRVVMGDGSIVYYAMGVVTDFNGKTPIISPYPEPLPLGDWYPAVTHINGMDVNPQEGLLAASALQESVNKALDGEDEVAFGQDAVDVLFTYSAKRGGMGADLWDCIKGKVEVEDGATEKQKEIMLDAVRNKHRTTVSAHSRGTIKTDNAVMSVHDILSAEYLSETRADYYEAALAHWKPFAEAYGVSVEEMAEMTVKQVAGKKAKEDMNQYIQLIYAGNAVSLPSSLLKPSMYVGGMDFVSMSVGSYTSTLMGTKSVGALKGHEFIGNYVPAVSKEIAADIEKR